jgi:hypothetical protein
LLLIPSNKMQNARIKSKQAVDNSQIRLKSISLKKE